MWCDLEKIIQGVGTAVYFCQLCKESSYSFGGFSLNWISTRISNAALLAENEVFENVIVNRLDQQDLLTHHAALGVSGSQVEDRVSIYIRLHSAYNTVGTTTQSIDIKHSARQVFGKVVRSWTGWAATSAGRKNLKGGTELCDWNGRKAWQDYTYNS